MSGLTDKQRAVLDFMLSNARLSYPTVREIAEHLKVYPATIQDHIKALRRKGYIVDHRTKKQD